MFGLLFTLSIGKLSFGESLNLSFVVAPKKSFISRKLLILKQTFFLAAILRLIFLKTEKPFYPAKPRIKKNVWASQSLRCQFFFQQLSRRTHSSLEIFNQKLSLPSLLSKTPYNIKNAETGCPNLNISKYRGRKNPSVWSLRRNTGRKK